jgi:ribokinase
MIDLISYLPRLPSAGETLIGGTFELGYGGKGANQAVAARRFGCEVAMIGCLGEDVFGKMTLAHLAQEDIDVSAMQRTHRAASGVAPIWVEPDGTNRIACIAGANDQIDPIAAAAAIERLRPEIVIGQFEIPQQATLAAFRAARRVGALSILNPAPADGIDPELLALTSWLIPNETEFAHLAEIDDPTGITDSALEAVASTLGQRLVVTLGSEGAALAAPNSTVRRISAPVVDAVDTTGAGDAFIGAFAAGLATGLPAPQATQLAVAFASDTVTRRGTQRSLPSPDQCAEMLQQTHGHSTAARP